MLPMFNITSRVKYHYVSKCKHHRLIISHINQLQCNKRIFSTQQSNNNTDTTNPNKTHTNVSANDTTPQQQSQYPKSAIPPYNSVDNIKAYTATQLTGSCKCNSVGFTATGKSVYNFICHCSLCREATNKPYTASSTFHADQITWKNENNIEHRSMNNSTNKRLYCKSCDGYIGDDATQTLGLYALPIYTNNIDSNNDIADDYKPNMHIFYNDKVKPINDSLPKYTEMYGSKLVVDNNKVHKHNYMENTTLHHTHYDINTGIYKRDILPYSAVKQPEPLQYKFTEYDIPNNHKTIVTTDKLQQRIKQKYIQANTSAFIKPTQTNYDVIIIGAGHNGLVSAAYLARAGLNVCVLERRHIIGGAAVTEELYPGFKFSRFSYLAGLFRPQIIKDLDLEKYGFEYLTRVPSSFTPTLHNSEYNGKYLLLGQKDSDDDLKSISQFSSKDADMYPKYEQLLNEMRDILTPLLDNSLPLFDNYHNIRRSYKQLKHIATLAYKYKHNLPRMYELFTGSASQILNRYFEADILKTTLATDSVIGSMTSPKDAGSAYVLLHHVMGESAGRQGVWSYHRGGMGGISNAIAKSAQAAGTTIVTNAQVDEILFNNDNNNDTTNVQGVRLADGTILTARTVLSNATPYHTFLELIPGFAQHTGYSSNNNNNVISPLSDDFMRHIRFTDYSSGAAKINCAVSELPNFLCYPTVNNKPGLNHQGTIHFEYRMDEIENAACEASAGMIASQPVIEMTIPTSVDNTLAPAGKHVVQLFVQYVPYNIDSKLGDWHDESFKQRFADRVFRIIDQFAPNFSRSVLYRDILSPLDIERIVGLQGGNIFHSSLSLSQLAYNRPAPNYSHHRTPVKGLYLCGSGAHPGLYDINHLLICSTYCIDYYHTLLLTHI